MNTRVLAWIWFHLLVIQIVVEPTSSVSLKQNDGYEKIKLNEYFKPDIPTEKLHTFELTHPVENEYMYEPKVHTERNRVYRQVESETVTSTELISVTESSVYDQSTTTEENSNKTVIPLTSTETYTSPTIPELIETTTTETNIPVTTTEKYDNLELPDEEYTTSERSLPNSVNVFDYDESTSNTVPTEFVTPTTHWLAPVENETVVSYQRSAVDTKKLPERLMILHPLKNHKNVRSMETVYNMLENTILKRETEEYVLQLNRRYEDLPLVETDNSIWRKYSRAVVENFVLDFCRNYVHYTVSEQSSIQTYKAEDYGYIYNSTLLDLQQKKGQTAIQLAATVRKAIDIYKAILDTPIGIVQSKCDGYMPTWLCFAEYVVRLADISDTCENIWYHAQVHLTLLQSIRNANDAKHPANEVVDELELRMESMPKPNNDVNFLFEFILSTLDVLRDRLQDSLLSQVRLYSFIRELQAKNNLNCLNIDGKGW